ncbi:MAG: glycosyltransferase family 39 protein [Planctomycetota bacterium]
MPVTKRERGLVIGLVLFFALQAFLSMLAKSATADEPLYLAAGDRILRTGDLETNEISSPFLLKPLVAVPLLLLTLDRPPGDSVLHGGKLIDQWLYARRFLYGSGADPDLMLGLCRGMSILLGMMLALSSYSLARSLLGRGAALAMLALFSVSPHLLAHTRLATLDIGLALLTIECLRHWERYLRGAGWRPVILAGIFLGLGFVAKTATLALAIYLGVVLVGRAVSTWWRPAGPPLRPSPLKALVVIGLLSLLVVNGAFGFKGSLRPLAQLEGGGAKLEAALGKLGSGIKGWVAHHVPLPLPASYQRLVLEQGGRASSPKQVYFHGELRPGGWWWFMGVAWALKTPLAVVMAVVAGFVALGSTVLGFRGEPRGRVWAVLGYAPLLLVFYSFVDRFGLVRYLLPAEPLVLMAAGSLVARLWRPGKLARGAAVGLLLLAAVPSWLSHPHYLAFTNVLTGGPNQAYRWFADSNLDWGQDLRGLAEYTQRHGVQEIWLSYFGSADPDALGLRYRRLPSIGFPPLLPGELWWFEDPSPRLPENLSGTVAISANCLAGILFPDPDLFARFRDLEPIAQVGHSILVYQVAP